MELTNERKEEMIAFDVDIEDEEAERLADVGLDLIKNDKNALINYAVNHILKEMIDKEKVQELIKKSLEAEQNASKSSS